MSPRKNPIAAFGARRRRQRRQRIEQLALAPRAWQPDYPARYRLRLV